MTSSASTNSTQKNGTIIFISNCRVNEQIITYMKNSNNVIQLYYGCKDSKQTETDSYNIQGTVNDYKKIFSSLIETKFDIIFMFENGHFTEDNEAEITKDCLYQFKYIISSLTNKGIKVNKMTLFANQVYSVTNQESVINPAGAALFGMAKCLPYEFPKMKVQMFDYDTMDHENFANSLSLLRNKAVLSIRNRTFYEEELIDIDREKTDNIIEFNQNGLYIITGGYGDLGIEIINSLQEEDITNIAVLGRSPENNIHPEKLERIRLLNKQGMNVFYRQISVENMEALDEFLQEMRERYKKIEGIIHAAGVTGEQYLFRTSDEQMESILAPKILGTYYLNELTKNDALSFFIVFSSVVTLYGAPGQTVYTAANSYMDAVIAQRKREGRPALSIKWAPWKETGMAYRYKNKDDGYFSMIDTGEAIELFHVIMGIKNGIFVLGSLNTALIKANMENQYLKMSVSIKNTEKQNELKSSLVKNSTSKSICFMSGRDDGVYTDIEKNLADIWSNILDRQDIDILMSFFDMGGDSIFATRMLTFIEQDYPDYVDIADIFNYQTIYDLAQYIDKKTNENIQLSSSMNELMEEILQGNITIDEGLKALNISKQEEQHE
jgi:polyketide synthase PksN